MTKRDYYEILGVQRGVDEGALKKAYRGLAMQYHPDRNPGDHSAEEKFKEASEAYEVLSDSEKRRVYDQWGHAGLEGRGFHGFDQTADIFSSFGDLFEDFFGGFGGSSRRGSSRAHRGEDMALPLNISFKESAFGVEKEIYVHKESACELCSGSGSKGGTKQRCKTCQGSGQVTHRQGFFMIQTTCPHCRGQGQSISDPCEECRGQGRVREKKNVVVKIPAGVENGMRLVLRGQGGAGLQGGPAGDLYVEVHIAADNYFVRHGEDVYCEVPVTFVQAVLGATVRVSTLEGEETLKIPEGVDSGTDFRLKKKGFPNVHSQKRGDQIVRVIVKTPKKISKKQRQLLEEFEKS